MDGRGLPLLSGPPPPPDSSESAEMGCRKCAKEFNILFTRSRRCNHCGYAYCQSCTDYQALMPRQSSSGLSGYDPMNVCAFCIEFLQITASGKGALKNLPLARLRKYAGAYNIRIDHAVEKDDVIEALLAARQPNGCLLPQNESYYRRYSVPNRAGPGPSSTRARVQNLFSSSSSLRSSNNNNNADSAPPPPPPPQHTRPEFARPDLEPDGGREDRGVPIRPRMQPFSAASGAPPRRNTATRPQSTPAASAPRPTPTTLPGSGPHSNYVPPPQPSYSSYPSYPSSYPNPQNSNPPPAPPRPQQYHPYASYTPYTPNSGASRSSHNLHVPPGHVPPRPGSVPPRQRASSAAPSTRTPPPAPPPPAPTLDQLLSMTTESLSSLSISSLKAILFANHVNSSMILEKGDLVKRVVGLVEDEKRERREHEERELEEQRQREETRRIEREREEREDQERIRIQHGMMEAFEREKREREGREQELNREREETAQRREEERIDGLQSDLMQVDSESESRHTYNGEHNPNATSSSSPPPPPTPPKTSPAPSTASPKALATAAFVERTGLCVVCQDEEANIAIVDCGHLAMCRSCCDAIMQSTRECPLCRTRIVTEARLLRIFKA